MLTIDELIDRRNECQLKAEAISEQAGADRWTALGLANRHIARVLENELPLTPGLENEILKCIDRVERGR
jgi:hypothetical protein